MGKYGQQVQSLLKKAAKLDIRKICPLHGPILTENLSCYLKLYDIWSSYKPENEGVMIAYTSVYGNTKKAVELLAETLEKNGCPKVTVCDLARSDIHEAVEDAFRYDRLVLATTTYNAEIFPYMREFINKLTERNFQNRTVGLMENGSWAPMAAKVMKGMLEKCKNLTYLDPVVTIQSAMNDANRQQIADLAAALCGLKVEADEPTAPAEEAQTAGKKYACKICGYVYEGQSLPEDFTCPLCKRPASFFEEIQ